VDAPALANPVRIREWLSALSTAEQAGLIGRADTQVLLGERVLVTAVEGPWVRVTVPAQPTPLDERGYPVWIPARQLTTEPLAPAQDVATVIASTAWLLKDGGGREMEVSFGTRLPVLGAGPQRVEVGLPGGMRRWIGSDAVVTSAATQAARPAEAGSIVRAARQFLGLRYLWAGTSGFGFDCSGLVYAVYRLHGINLPRDSGPQSTAGRAVARSDLRPADLVFFGSGGRVRHVAIHTGAGQILESPDVGTPIREIDLPSDAAIVAARRVLP
jgi:cell wall-associated NlpC family hydrolase